MRPRTRRRLSRRWFLATAAASLGVLVAAGYLSYHLGLRPPAPADSGPATVFIVNPGDSAPKVADHLLAAGLIRDRNAFITYVNFHGLRSHLQAGTYSLNPGLSAPEIADVLAHGRTASDRLIIPEGYRLSQIRDLAITHGITTADFNAALAAPHVQAFLADKPTNVSLEGYLFPDSYQVTTSTTATQLIDTMLNTFGDRVGPEYAQAFAAEGLNLHQGLTLASIVEREVNIPSDRPIVAQIFLKRWRTHMPLGSDVTVQYAADLAGVPFNLDLSSPYNTRKYAGLPPGPICNPGLSALDAVAHPAGTDYLYFLSGKDGKTHFAKTLAEHQANVAKYLK